MPRRLDQRHYNVAYYAANGEREIERVRTRQAATTEFLRKLREVPDERDYVIACGSPAGLSGVSERLEEKRNRWRYHADVLDQLRSVPCADCGGTFAPCAMDFDHRDASSKVAVVTQMIGRASIERMLAEAAKCDIVCTNCHRLRTFERREALRVRAGVAQLVER